MAAKRRPRGRPPLPKGQEREAALQIRLRAADRRKLEKAAQKAGEPISTWARGILLSEADAG